MSEITPQTEITIVLTGAEIAYVVLAVRQLAQTAFDGGSPEMHEAVMAKLTAAFPINRL